MQRLRRALTWGLTGCVGLTTLAGCQATNKPEATPVDRVVEAPPAPPPKAAEPEPPPPPAAAATHSSTNGDAIALVNGTAISRSAWVNLLIESHGLRVLDGLILLNAAKQRATQMGLTVSTQDIQAEHDKAVQRLASPPGSEEGPTLDAAAARKLLNEFLRAKNISRPEWQMRMEQRAYLSKIAEAEVGRMEITDDMLRQQYERTRGEKVQIRYIRLGSLAAVTRAKALLAEKKDFELVARQMSEHEWTAANGGLMPPFSRNDPGIPPLIREAAFKMKPGEVSTALQEQNAYHLIRLERRIPAGIMSFELADKKALRASLTADLVRQRQEDLEGELFRSAVTDIRDPRLRAQFEQEHGAMRR